MKELVIYHPDAFNDRQVLSDYSYTIHGEPVHCALVEAPPPSFNAAVHKNHVLVQKKAFSCNYRDIGVMLLVKKKMNEHHSFRSVPYAFGSEFSGIVAEVGVNVKHLLPGDRVIGDGNYPISSNPSVVVGLPTNQASKEFEVLNAHKLVKMPGNMTYEVGAGFTVGAQTVYAMINRLNLKAGQKVLLTAATSNTSLFAIYALQHTGVKIYCLVRNETSKRQLLDLQKNIEDIFVAPDATINYAALPVIKTHVASSGLFDAIIDPFSDSNLYRLIDLLNVQGKYITCGISNQYSSATKDIHLNELFGKMVLKNITIMGNCLGNTSDLIQAMEDYTNGKLEIPIASVIEGDVKQFFEETFLEKRKLGKVIFKY